MDIFGLGITIDYVDNGASAGLGGIAGTLSSIMGVAGTTASGVSSASKNINDSLSAINMLYAGKHAEEFGSKVMTSLFNVGKSITEIGSTYEKSRITLTALYGDVDIANQKIENLFDYAARTPFDMESLMPSFIGLKAMGMEADKTVTSINGVSQELLSFIGDLQVFRGIPMDQVMRGIRNAFGGNTRSLEQHLDIDIETVLGRSLAAGNADQFAQDIADLTAALKVDGLMMSMEGTWDQGFANMEDRFEYFKYVISQSGFFDLFKGIQRRFVEFVESISGEDIVAVGKGITEAFRPLAGVIDDLATKAIDFTSWLIDTLKTNPKVISDFIKMAAAIGSISLAVGVFMKAAGSMGIFLNGLRAISTALPGAIGMFGKLALVSGALYLAWKHDFLGIQTFTKQTMESVTSGLQLGQDALNGTYDGLKALKGSEDFFTNLEYNVGLASIALKAMWEELTTGKISDETFQALEEFNLTPIIEKFNDLRYAITEFFGGFGEGVTEGLGNIGELLSGILEPITEFARTMGLDDFADWLEGLGRINFDDARELGIAVGELGTYAAGVWALSSALGALGQVSGLGSLLGVLVGGGGSVASGGGLVGAIGNLIGFAVSHPLLTLLAAALVAVAAGFMQIEGATVGEKWENLNKDPNKALKDVWWADLYEESGFTTLMDNMFKATGQGGLEGMGLNGIWGDADEGAKKSGDNWRKVVGKLFGNQQYADELMGYGWMYDETETRPLDEIMTEAKAQTYDGQSMGVYTEDTLEDVDTEVKKSFMDIIKNQWESMKSTLSGYNPANWSLDSFDSGVLKDLSWGVVGQGLENYKKNTKNFHNLLTGTPNENSNDASAAVEVIAPKFKLSEASLKEAYDEYTRMLNDSSISNFQIPKDLVAKAAEYSATVVKYGDEAVASATSAQQIFDETAARSAANVAIINGDIEALRIANDATLTALENRFGEVWGPIRSETKSAVDDIILELKRLDDVVIGVNVRMETKTSDTIGGEAPGFASGGYIMGEGLAYLHDNEYVVNSPLTSSLENFLNESQGNGYTPISTDYVEKPSVSISDMFADDSTGNSFTAMDDNGNVVEINVEAGAIQVNGTSLNEEQLTRTLTGELWDRISRLLEKSNMRNYRGLKEGITYG